jgi:dolichyl-phosphate beta-glucosyltransferase
MNKTLISVVIPCRNQAEKIDETISGIVEHSKKLEDYNVEIIFVNDRSTDRSRGLAEKWQSNIPGMQILDTPKKFVGIGKGLAVKLGMLAAKGDLRVFMDADNSTKFSEIDKLLIYAKDNDIVLGTRYSSAVVVPQNNWFKAFFSSFKDVFDVLVFGHAKRYTATIKQGRFREFVSRGGNFAFTILLGQSFTDSRCGFKMYNSKSAEAIFPKLLLGGFGFDTEALVLAKKYKFRMIEVPVDWYDDAGASNVGIKSIFDSFGEIFRIQWNMITGKYKEGK